MPQHPTHRRANRARRHPGRHAGHLGRVVLLLAPLLLTACSNPFGSGLFGGGSSERRTQLSGSRTGPGDFAPIGGDSAPRQSTFLDLFTNADDPDTTLEVNRFIWQAAQEVLNFMPVEAVDPFSGVISYGYGVPPGGGRAYRATVYVTDPALDARSLNVALQSQGGAVPAATQRAVEDAILTRARQLRVAAGRL